jgi:trimeric autotransporter adhesin
VPYEKKTRVHSAISGVVAAVLLFSCKGGEIAGPPAAPTPPPVASITVSVAEASLNIGASVQLTAATLDASGNALAGRAITWSSSDQGLATVSTSGMVTGVAVGGPVTISATSEGKIGTATITVVPVPVASITVTPSAPTLALGSSVQLAAATLDASGTALSGRAVTWSSSDSAVASVSTTGMVTARALGGPVTVTASSEGKNGTAAITVIPIPVASVAVSPAAPTITVGGSVQLTAETLDASGNPLANRTVTWTSSNPAVASVSTTGVVTGVLVGGPVTITAASEGKTGTAIVTVAAVVIPVASMSVNPSAPTITVGTSVQLVAVTLDADGNALTGRAITWSSSNPAIATVSPSGLVTGIVVGGPVTITASSEGKSASAAVTIAAVFIPVASVSVAPASPTIAIGSAVQLSAVTRDADGNQLSGRPITWSSTNSAVAVVSENGLAIGVDVGQVTITATSEGKSGTAIVTVIVVPVGSVTVTPPAPIVVVGASVQLTANIFDGNGNALAGRAVSWSSSNPAVAIVSQTGLVTAVALGGPVTITAASEGKTGSSSVTVIAVPVVSVTVTSPATTVPVGASIQLTAVTRDADGNVLTGRTITWSSSISANATVSLTGLVTAVAAGPVTITATSEGKSGSTGLTVVAASNTIITGVHDANTFLNSCPTNDPAYNTIRQDFVFYSDGVLDNVAVTCTEPYSTLPIAQLTDELVVIQTLRLIYYMSQGTAGRLPWTNQSLYDWMKSSVAGINFHATPGLSACCDIINGKRYIITSRKDAASRDFYRTWNGLSGYLGLLAHEARHVTGPGHVNGCPLFPNPGDPLGCDATYDLNNLGSYGVQYWLTSGWATGFINVGIGCAAPAIAFDQATWAASSANGYISRFVTNAPASVAATIPYGGTCLP